MIECDVDTVDSSTCAEADLIGGFISELRRLVKKTESGIRTCHGCQSLLELERAYFHDILELLLSRTLEECSKLIGQTEPTARRNRLRNDLILGLKRPASMILIESDLCSTVLMYDFSELMARFVAQMERIARLPQIAA